MMLIESFNFLWCCYIDSGFVYYRYVCISGCLFFRFLCNKLVVYS